MKLEIIDRVSEYVEIELEVYMGNWIGILAGMGIWTGWIPTLIVDHCSRIPLKPF
tara:strand:- start:558 stop:722 length:165 start_codon:yes stop_codon:yes gene_type:complete